MPFARLTSAGAAGYVDGYYMSLPTHCRKRNFLQEGLLGRYPEVIGECGEWEVECDLRVVVHRLPAAFSPQSARGCCWWRVERSHPAEWVSRGGGGPSNSGWAAGFTLGAAAWIGWGAGW
ncbi:hypothetical protein GCM10009745_37830 [Kribbella yunnanensis]|uniref:Uncharacterized protein n=1 Tax=Kribbella yunnanensis TaxID=190194 RepID=A0ABN2HJX4_9ACTN